MRSDRRDLADKINSLERRYDAQFKVVFNLIRELIRAKPKDRIEVRPFKKRIDFGRDDQE